MSMSEMENLRHAETRGKLLSILAEDYTRNMTTIGTLAGALDASGFSLTEDKLHFHLLYLEDSGYIRLWRNADMPSFRSDRGFSNATRDTIRFARLTPRGLQLVDGDGAADPKVKF